MNALSARGVKIFAAILMAWRKLVLTVGIELTT
jgi:hypothetical protein